MNDFTPFDRFNTLYTYQRVKGVKIEYWPEATYSTTSADEVTAEYPIWTRIERTDPCDTPAHPLVLAHTRTDCMQELMQVPSARKHKYRYKWKRYFKIKPVKQQTATGSGGGIMGRWYTTDYGGAESTKYGMIYVEQPVSDTAAQTNRYGRMIITKYIVLKTPTLTMGN